MMQKVKSVLKTTWKKVTVAVALIVALLVSVFAGPIIFPPTPPTGAPGTLYTVCDSQTSKSGVATPRQDHVFTAHGIWWVMFTNTTHMLLNYSNGAGDTWYKYAGNPVAVTTEQEGADIYFDGTYLYYVRTEGTAYFYVRRGDPAADGTITWTSSEISVGATHPTGNVAIEVDTSGYMWVGLCEIDPVSEWFEAWVTKSGNNDGTWGTSPSPFPYQLTDTYDAFVDLCRLSNNKMYIAYTFQIAEQCHERVWSGSSMGDEVDISSLRGVEGNWWQFVNDGEDNLYLCTENGMESPGYNYTFWRRSIDTGSWTSHLTVPHDTGAYTSTVLCTVGRYIYLFWRCAIDNKPAGCLANHIYYQLSTDNGVSWGTPVEWLEDVNGFALTISVTSNATAEGYIGFAVTIHDADPDPRTIAFANMTVPTATDEYDYVDYQSDIDSVSDKGTHSNFTAQKDTNDILDTLTEANVPVITNNVEHFVDNDVSDVDSHPDHGTHNVFANEQDYDSDYDQITESSTGSASIITQLWVNGFDSTHNDWTLNGVSPYLDENGDTHTISTSTSPAESYWYDFANLPSDCTGINSAYLCIYAITAGNDGASFYIHSDAIKTGQAFTGSYAWYNYSVTFYLPSKLDIDGAKLRIDYWYTGGKTLSTIDGALLRVDYTTINYEMDLEFQYTTVAHDSAEEYLCIHTGSIMGSENLKIDVWYSSAWTTIVTLTSSQTNVWVNTSITSYLIDATITFRFKGSVETEDTIQNNWRIECNLIHTYDSSDNYRLEIEETFENLNYTRTNEELCIKTGTLGAETIKVERWTGSDWSTLIASLSASTWNNVSITSYLTSRTFIIRFVDGTQTSDSSSDTWQKDAALVHTWNTAGEPTTLNQGWTSFTVWSIDVGKDLGDVSTSLDSESIPWTTFVLQQTDGDRFPFINDWTINEGTVISTGDTLYIYCTAADTWSHNY